ncbi:MAG: MBL fold metallo-hydrolase [Bacilli bacterium]|nr:MBL fold metallo-hydrolase [Bacilli bacterium]
MRIKIISSGSKANCTLISCGSTNLLIDAGPTSSFIISELEKENISPKDITGIIITHTHSDHIKGLKVFVKNSNTSVYITEELLPEIIKIVPPGNIKLIDKAFTLNDIKIELLKMSHDVPCHGILLTYNEKELVYITDTGYVNKKYIPKLVNKDFYIIETNYNEKMLMEGPYPYTLKQRIIGDSGHMSNKYAGTLLAKCVGPKTKYVYLAHISEHNNEKELALKEVKEELKDIDFEESKIILTDQYVSCEMVEI